MQIKLKCKPMATHQPPVPALQAASAPQPRFRSGAVARLAGMPVSTLRIWEQRYRAVGPTAAPSGHRLYSVLDVGRVLLLRQLTQQGHAIGTVAALDTAQLQQLARSHAANPAAVSSLAAPESGAHAADLSGRAAERPAPLRLVVVGQALALRLQRIAVVRGLSQPLRVRAVFESLADVARAAPGEAAAAPTAVTAVDLLLWQAPGLHASDLPAMQAAQHSLRARQVAVVYRFAGAAALSAAVATGARVVCEPADDETLGAWLASLHAALLQDAEAPGTPPPPAPAPEPAEGDLTPRRFDDAALTAIAGQSSTVACECPRHVAALLMQLSAFEAYSADCAHRSPDDAALHAYLQRVAGASRLLFEAALDRVARHEGLLLR